MVSISPKKVLSDLGLSITKAPPAARTLSAEPRSTQGWVVELVGPSGVGKTTLRQQVEPVLKKDWFFEHHAKGLLGHVPENDGHADYIKRLFTARLNDLQTLDLSLERIADIGQRVCEVVRLGLVAKSCDAPRGFIMDDGLLHFFAGQILEQERGATEAFLTRTAVVFLMPGGAAAQVPFALENPTQLDVYRALRDLVQDIGCPTLVLDSDNRAGHADQMLSFFANDIPNA